MIQTLNGLLETVEATTSGKTRIVQTRLVIRLVPVTRVEFERGRRSATTSAVLLLDHDDDPATPSIAAAQSQADEGGASEMKTLHLLGFNNTISDKEAALFRDWPRIMTLATIGFLVVLVVIMLLFVLVVY